MDHCIAYKLDKYPFDNAYVNALQLALYKKMYDTSSIILRTYRINKIEINDMYINDLISVCIVYSLMHNAKNVSFETLMLISTLDYSKELILRSKYYDSLILKESMFINAIDDLKNNNGLTKNLLLFAMCNKLEKFSLALLEYPYFYNFTNYVEKKQIINHAIKFGLNKVSIKILNYIKKLDAKK